MSWTAHERRKPRNMPVRVVISPSQSSFFAGEPFSATITFTNVAAPEPSPARAHKRGAHSISSAPLARPPTSPGLPPRRSSSALARDSLPVRKGLIGTPVAHDKHIFLETRQSPTSPRIPVSLSRTDTLPLSSDHPHARKSSLLDGQFSLDALSPTTSIPPQPRTPTLSLTTISESSRIVASPPSSPLSLASATPTTPRVSSPLSPSYSQPAYQPGTYPSTVQAYPSAAVEATPRPYHPHHQRRFSQQVHIGLGHPAPTSTPPQPQSAFASTFPKSSNTNTPTNSNNNNNELILYSYAQLVGTVHVLPESGSSSSAGINGSGIIPPPSQEQSLRMNRIRRMLVRRRAVVGGGSMDISRSMQQGQQHRSWGSIGGGGGGGGGGLSQQYPTQVLPVSSSRRRNLGAQQPQVYGHQHTRSASFSQSLISLLSPLPSTPALNTNASVSDNNVSMPGGGHGLGLGISTTGSYGYNNHNNATFNGVDEVVDPELALPTFEAQPSMLAVDLALAPGESKTYRYMIKLPEVLPPTYRGRALRFSYELVVGTCRASSALSGFGREREGREGSVSRVMKVPVRVYNYVTVDHPPRPYDILWPVTHGRMRRYYQRSREKGREREMMMIPEVQGKVVEENESDSGEDGIVSGLMRNRRGKNLNTNIRLPSGDGRGREDEASLNELRLYTVRLLISLPPPPPPSPPLSSSTTLSPSSPLTVSGNQKTGEKGYSEDEEVVSPLSSISESESSSSIPPQSRSLAEDTDTTTNNENNDNRVEGLKKPSLVSLKREEETMRDRREEVEDDKNMITGCREAVEILTRLPKKASYDVHKEGVKVAVLTFTKSAYRLGETVTGVVELNERRGRARVLQLSAILEAHEVLPKTVASTPITRAGGEGLRRAYAEHYAAFTLDTLRTTFALDIPSDASPGFQVKIDDDDDDDDDDDNGDDDNDNDYDDDEERQHDGGGRVNSRLTTRAKTKTKTRLESLGGLEWKIRLCLLVAVASPDADTGSEGVVFRSLERDGGRGEWGSSWRAPERFGPLEKQKMNRKNKENGVGIGVVEGKRSWTRILVDSMWGAVTGLSVEEEEEDDGGGGYIGKEELYYGEARSDTPITTTATAMATMEKLRDYDGIKTDLGGGIGRGVDFSGDDDDDSGGNSNNSWKEVKLETVECEVPIKVWPGNTAFRAVDVVFDV